MPEVEQEVEQLLSPVSGSKCPTSDSARFSQDGSDQQYCQFYQVTLWSFEQWIKDKIIIFCDQVLDSLGKWWCFYPVPHMCQRSS